MYCIDAGRANGRIWVRDSRDCMHWFACMRHAQFCFPAVGRMLTH